MSLLSSFKKKKDDTLEDWINPVSLVDLDLPHVLKKAKKPIESRDYFTFDNTTVNMILQSYDRNKPLEEQLFVSLKDSPLYPHLLRLKETCVFYDNNTQNPFLSGRIIFYRTITEGPAFAEYLSDIRKYSIRKTFGNKELQDFFLDYPIIESSLEEVFDPRNLFPWENPDGEDWKLMLEHSSKTSKKKLEAVLNKLSDIFDGIKDKELPPMDFVDYLSYFKNTKVFDVFSQKTTTNYEAHFANMQKGLNETNRFNFKRVFVYKTPGESRDCLEADIATLHTIVQCDYYIRYLCKEIFDIKLGKNITDVYTQMQSLNSRNKYLMVDIRKCGLTFPRKILVEFLQFFSNKYPSISCFKNTYEAYKADPTIWVDSVPYAMTRGTGLGMLNGLVTLIFYVIYKTCKKDIFSKVKTSGLFLGDDQMIVLRNMEDRINQNLLLDNYTKYLRNLSLDVHENKPYLGSVGQFCEMYTKTPIYTEKKTTQFSIILKALLQPNIVAAKAFLSNVYNKYWGLSLEDNNLAFRICLLYWGYELDPAEFQVPIEMGGWIKFVNTKLNLMLQYLIDDFEETPIYCKKLLFYYKEPKVGIGVISKKAKKLYKKTKEKFKFTESENILLEQDFLYEKIEASIKNYTLIATDNNRTYRRIYYNKVLFERQKAIKQKHIPNYNEIENYVITNHWNNFSIPAKLFYDGKKIPMVDFKLTELYPETETDDLERLILNITYPELVRPPKTGCLANIFQALYNKNTLKGIGYLNFYRDANNWYISQFGKLLRFGKQTGLIYQNLLERGLISLNSRLLCEKADDYKLLESYALFQSEVNINSQIVFIDGIPCNWDSPELTNVNQIWKTSDIQRDLSFKTEIEITESDYILSQFKDLFYEPVYNGVWEWNSPIEEITYVEEEEDDSKFFDEYTNPVNVLNLDDYKKYVMSIFDVFGQDHAPESGANQNQEDDTWVEGDLPPVSGTMKIDDYLDGIEIEDDDYCLNFD